MKAGNYGNLNESTFKMFFIDIPFNFYEKKKFFKMKSNFGF